LEQLLSHRQLPEQKNKLPEEGYWIFRINSDFIEASRNFIFSFLLKKAAKIVKIISIHTKSTDLIFRTLKQKYSSRDTFPLTSSIFSSGPDRPAAGQGEVLQEAD
jgi:hypothetical protein